MSHLKSISFDNFRIFKDKTSFELSPITYLTGPNSSGKSSLLKALLLLKNNQTSDLQVLDFSGPKHNLGAFDNAITKNSENKDSITFGFTASINAENYPYSYNKSSLTTKRSVYHILFEIVSKQESDIYVELTYIKNERSGKLHVIEIFADGEEKSFMKMEIAAGKIENHTLKINLEKITKNKILKEIFLKHVVRDKYTLTKAQQNKIYKISPSQIQEKASSKFYDEPVLIFSKLYEQFLVENINQVISKELHSYFLGMPLRRLLKDFASLIDNLEYLEAVRANTKRLYTNDSQGTSFNELILEYRSRDISEKSINFTNKWLQKFEIADEIVFENVEGVATTIYLKKGDSKIALADLGYGITQFIPILLKIALEEPISDLKNITIKVVKKLILLEEPETNLHPKLQSLIADFLLDAIRTFEIQFIVETHSEYLIRKTQILTAEKELKINESIIYYFNNINDLSEGQNQIVKIKINENGSLDNDFGQGFFDEATNLKFELLKIKSESKK